VAARQADAWRRILLASGSAPPDILHLHHLTPLHDAARQLWPTVPTITHLHGTELLMLEEIEHSTKSWPHAKYWADRPSRHCRCQRPRRSSRRRMWPNAR
jgi:hypothetical protein